MTEHQTAKRQWSSLSFWHVGLWFSQHHLLKRLPFPHVYSDLHCCKLIDQNIFRFFPRLYFFFFFCIDLCASLCVNIILFWLLQIYYIVQVAQIQTRLSDFTFTFIFLKTRKGEPSSFLFYLKVVLVIWVFLWLDTSLSLDFTYQFYFCNVKMSHLYVDIDQSVFQF